jgi:hypothetical protein
VGSLACGGSIADYLSDEYGKKTGSPIENISEIMKASFINLIFFYRRTYSAQFAWILIALLNAGAACESAESFPVAHKDETFTAVFRQTNHWAAGDVATTIPLSDGRVLWLFGDSYIDQLDPSSGTVPCLFDARNSLLLQSTNDLMHPKTLSRFASRDKSFFRPPNAGKAEFWPCFWPGDGFQSGNTVYVYLSEMQNTPQGGMWGFKVIGQYWAKISFPELKVTGYAELPSFNGILFWCGFVQDEQTGLTYAFGDKKHGISSDVYVARFPTANPESNWTFWDGKNWSDNVTNAAIITKGASTSVNICKVKDRYLLITTAFSVACDQGKEIYLSTSASPTGPFSPRKKIFTVDDTVDGHHPCFYSAVPHSEFINEDGLLITYCINGYEPCVPTCVKGRMNPDYYRPRAIRLPLK